MSVRELSSPPRMKVLYPKAVAGVARSFLEKVPGLGGGEPKLPDTELVLAGVEIDREHVAAYDRVCGFRLRDTVAPTYPHVLAFPLSMELMTDLAFPFPVVGLVHIRNRIEQLRPIRTDEQLALRVRAENLAPHDRGAQFEIVAHVRAREEVVWRSRSTYLHRESSGSSGKDGGGERPEPPRPSAVWKVPGDIGRRYADVSGDHNPIHLHPVSARLFGMPRPIAHGMWMKARCLAALESLIPDRCDVDVQFKLPAFLPGKVSFASWPQDDGRGFALHDGKNEKPHLTGALRRGSG